MQRKSRLTLVMMAALLMVGMVGIQPAKPVQAANPLRISQVYGGGNTGATYTHDYFEIFNSGSTPVSLAGMSIQYASATGDGYFGGAANQLAELPDITLGAGQYLLIQGASGANGTTLPLTPDVIDTTPINASGSAGKVDLVNSQVSLGCNGGSTPCSPEQLALIVDLVGYGTANFFEGLAAAPGLSNTTAAMRLASGCTDIDDNSVDFEALAPVPRNSTSPTNSCGLGETFPERFIISEYVEGSRNNKAIELFNGTGAEINLQNYFIRLYSNGSTSSSSTLFWEEETLLPAGETFVVVDGAASEALKAYADLLHAVTAFTGDDTLVLYEITSDGNIIRDSFGRLGYDPGTAWGSGDTATAEHTLVRKATVCQGDTLPGDIFEPSLEYNGFPQDTYSDLGSHTMICGPGDQAPTVASTLPTNGGSAQKTDDIFITFSEPVTVVEPWFNIICGNSTVYSAAVDDNDPIFTLNPIEDFAVGDSCTVTIDYTKVYDDDTDDATANYMLEDYSFSFTVVPGCGDLYTPIYEIQGVGETSPKVGQTVTTEGVVVGDFQNNDSSDSGNLNGFFIQEPTADGNSNTSEGVFIYYPSGPDVNEGDRVRVTGAVSEYYGLTEITGSALQHCSSGNVIAATPLYLPVTNVSNFEKYESMLVTFPQPLVISEYFNFDYYGEIVLTSTRHMTPTAFVEPGEDAIAAAQAYLLDCITLDDGRTTQNPDPAIHPNGDIFDMDNLFRGGGTVTDVTGVLDYSYNLYRVQPTTGATYEDANPRTTAPEILEGDLKVASFNVLNYFVTLDDGTHDICGPSGDMECRGADTADEFERQRAKILSALGAIDADIFGLMEIENEHPGGGDAVADLVAGLNLIKGAGTYAYIDTGAIGGDAIKQAILYKPASVTPVGEYQILDSSVDSRFIDTKNRPVLAQVFRDNATGDEFVVAVNHLKSKGSDCNDLGDPDTGDGQGNCNLTRKAAAEALVDWLANPTYFPDVENVLIIGDLNSYDKEDPIDAIKLGADDAADTADDYLDMILEIRGEYAYGYVYDGQTGYLDHALANPAMAEAVVDVNFWHINADEPDLIDYDMSFKLPAQDLLYAPDAYRSSDHDPVIITLNMNAAPVAVADAYTTDEDTVLTVLAPGVLENDSDADGDEMTIFPVDDVSNGTLDWTLNGGFIYTPDAEFNGIDTFSYKLTDGEAYSDTVVVTITVNSVNDWVTANDDEYETMTGVTLDIAAPGVLANDVLLDPDETVTLGVNAQPTNGTLTLNDDGSFTYVPNAGFFGVDTFEYQLNSTLPTMLQGEFSDTAVVTITVTARQIFLPLILK